MNNLLLKAFVKKIKSENMDNKLQHLKDELKQWQDMEPVNNMGKLARQTKIDNIKNQIENMSNNNPFINDPNEYTMDAYNENAVINEYFDKIVRHDYSYQYSDDHRYWMAGTASEKEIEKLIEVIINTIGYNAEMLLEESLNEVKEGFVDGLTHRVIRSWFKPYVKNVDDIFVKPNFDK